MRSMCVALLRGKFRLPAAVWLAVFSAPAFSLTKPAPQPRKSCARRCSSLLATRPAHNTSTPFCSVVAHPYFIRHNEQPRVAGQFGGRWAGYLGAASGRNVASWISKSADSTRRDVVTFVERIRMIGIRISGHEASPPSWQCGHGFIRFSRPCVGADEAVCCWRVASCCFFTCALCRVLSRVAANLEVIVGLRKKSQLPLLSSVVQE